MKLRYYAAASLLALAAALVFFRLLPSLPERVPVHWNVHGRVDAYGSPWVLFLIGPVAMAIVMLLFALLPALSPRRFEVTTFERTYLDIMLILVAIPGYIFAITLWAALHGPLDILPAALGGLCVLHVLLGNLLGKVRRNFYIGIRTPWTLADERVWYATHRLAAKALVVTGLLGVAIIVAGLPALLALAPLLIGITVPILYSLLYYKRLERDGELGATG